ncbi:MAG: MBL fold metallo-hydrolase [Candidatus Electrothrix sp. LOE2]|nr:MBL fold metallo-hydrolase [Candidatus Electrothrix sp. LOE2]
MSNENRLNAHRKSNPWQPGMIFWLAVALALLGLPGGAVAQGFSISGIEVNQAIGVQKDGHLNFVAGKPTVVRVNLSDQVTVDENTSKVIAKIGDQEVGSLYPKSEKRPVQWVDFICEPTNNCGNWQAGTYSFEVNVNGVTTTTEAKYVFQERKILKVLALPIKARYGDSPMQVQVTKESNWKTMHKFMKSVFPVSTIEWEIRNELDLSDKKDENGNYKYDMASENGSGDALGELVQYLQRENRKGGKKYDMIVGFVAKRTGPDERGQGIASPDKGVAIVVASDPDASATVAHEIAHLYEIGDTYDDAEGASFNCPVNPAPKNFRGANWDQSQKNINCENGGERFSANSAAATVLATNHPYEVQGRGLLGKMACYMGSGAGGTLNYWTTPDAYDHLFNQLAPNPQGEQSLTTPQRVIDFYGEINAQGTVELGDWEDFTTTDTVADTTGQYQVVGLDASGATVASQAFDVSFFIRSNPVRTVEWAVFEGTMRFPQEVVKFQVKKDTQVLAEQTVSANAPVVNLLVEPCLCLWALPWGLAAIPCMFVAPQAAVVLLKIGALGIRAGHYCTAIGAALPWASIWTVTPTRVEIFFYGLLLLLWFLSSKMKRFRRTARSSVIVGALLLALHFTWGLFFPEQSGVSTVSYLDVGQGSSGFLRSADGSCILIDGGGNKNSRINVGEQVIAPYLWRQRVWRLEQAVITHPHSDHFNGMDFILARFRPKKLFVNGDPRIEGNYQEIIDQAVRQGTAVILPASGDTIEKIEEYGDAVLMELIILSGAVQTVRATQQGRGSVNDASLVLRYRHGKRSFLFPGDIGKEKEAALLEKQVDITADVLLAPHHGSSTSSSPVFIKAVAPALIIVSAGKDRKYFPAPINLAAWEEQGIPVAVTGDQGTISCTTDGDELRCLDFAGKVVSATTRYNAHGLVH